MRARRLRWIAATTAGVVVAGGSAAFVLANGGAEEPDAALALESAPVSMQNLVETTKTTGTLGYADQSTVRINGDGLVTWLPDEKTVLERGDVVARVNHEPIVLLYGELPFYRALEYGVADGPDVKQLKKNLDKLGMLPDEVTVDDEFTQGTRQAVKNLQDELDVKETGLFEPNDFVVMPGAVKVGAAADQGASIGSPAKGPLYEVSSKKREIIVDLSSTVARLLEVDDEATVTLPDGSTTSATVAEIGAATTDKEGSVVVPVTLELEDTENIGEGTGLPVNVEFVAKVAEDVLAVPVVALIALAEGGYAVEMLDSNGTTQLVPVDPGMYADGLVEVEGDLEEGDDVVVPA